MSSSWWANSGINPSNWGTSATTAGEPTSVDWSGMEGSGNITSSTTPGDIGSGASGTGPMNWAGLAQGLSNLSKQSGGSGSSDGTNVMQGSRSVANTGASGGALSPAGGGSGASALASMLNQREQLAQYLMLAAMQGKGRSKGGGGLLG